MASFRKRNGAWRAEICKNGKRLSATFDTKTQAQAWAAEKETEINAGARGDIPNKNFGQLLERYAKEVSSTKRGQRWESMRINAFLGIGKSGKADDLARIPLYMLDETHICAWRDRRLQSVAPDTVRREITLLSHACSIAVREWKWLKENPFKGVRRPTKGQPRDRRISAAEMEQITYTLGYSTERILDTQASRAGAAFLFAIETAMRAGEIVKLEWDRVDLDTRVVTLIETKNGHKRNVPLSGEAIRILNQLGRVEKSVFRINSANLDAQFRKARTYAKIENLHFHDTRHEAITRLAKILNVLDLARMVGHRDLRQLQVYYNESAADIARKLG